jgi:hypothetical protein
LSKKARKEKIKPTTMNRNARTPRGKHYLLLVVNKLPRR